MKKFFQLALMALVLLAVAMISALTADARKTAAASGLLLDWEGGFYSNDVAEGRVLSQIPVAGTLVRRG